MRLAHFGDHHLRDRRELPHLERQLARALDALADHLVFTGDLVDRWDPPLLRDVRGLLSAYGLLDPARLTIIHGNHDLASSGGWPRRRSDILRMALRFWDPPPMLARRRRLFMRSLEPAAAALPFARPIGRGWRLLAIDSTPFPWLPFTVTRRALTLRTASGAVTPGTLQWISSLPPHPSVLVMHHYPLPTPDLHWNGGRVVVPMEVHGPVSELLTAAGRAGVKLVVCGHVHRSRTDQVNGLTVGLQGQSGADWADRPFTIYDLDAADVRARLVSRDGNSVRTAALRDSPQAGRP